MDNLFLKYMKERSEKTSKPRTHVQTFHKPVITISRQFGCPGETIAEKLTEVLNQKIHNSGGRETWKWISKEIIEESAKKLKMSSNLMNDLSKYKERGFFENLATFFSNEYYPSESKVQNTIAGFIHDTASEGNVVILGRASEVITHNFINSFHVRLFAPIEWRTEQISTEQGLPISISKKMCLENDMRRDAFRHYFSGEKDEMSFFDAVYNCETVSINEIIEMIIIVAETRGFV